jgi:PAS domain S-box-containing protein
MKNPQDTGLHPEQPDMPSRESPSSSTSASFTISPSLLNKLVHFAHDAILVRDLEGHIIFWNEGAEHLYGWTAQEVLNKITHTLLQTHFPISLDDLNQTLEQHGKWEGNLIHYRRDGAQVIVESRQVLVRDEEGRPSAILEINRNITERHRLQQMEEESEKLKGQFVSMATHELLTPVTVITGYADRLLSHSAQQHEHQLDEWQHEKVQEIKQAAWQLTSLTENLLDVTRMQAGLFELEQRSTDLPVLAGRVIKRLQTTTTLHQLIFQTRLAHLWAMVDVLRTEQVLSNLLSNAIKYSPRGGPIEIILEADQRMHEARFQIHDQGMGIPLNQQAHLFERFARAENVRAAGIRGTGLGLYLCRELVERQGGHISFESAEGAGSTFFFSLPYQKIET